MEWENDKKKILPKGQAADSGSITVFLCILFLLFFSLLGVAFENVRVLSSQGYMRTAAYAAAMTVFGNYNKELYEEYGFFAYGGYDGKEKEDLAEEFNEILVQNIQTKPEKEQSTYSNLYRIGEVESSVENEKKLVEQEIFDGQVKAYLKGAAVEDLKESLKGKISGDLADNAMDEKLALTREYENGEFDGQQETDTETVEESDVADSNMPEDVAGGNPLEIFKDMVRDGILNLVCDASRLSDGVIEPIENLVEETEERGDKGEDKCASEYLQEMLEGTELSFEQNILEKEIQKLAYISYANKQFSFYASDKNRTTKYGMEYLAAGKKEERDNLSYIVNRLLGIRTMINFVAVVSNAVLQEKSFATATALAGFTGLPPVVKAVQYVILLILAFEEACVDVTALLEGRSVPMVKSAKNLKMTYEEVCLASKTLFASKAATYPVEGKSAADITYQQYLCLFLLTISSEELRSHIFDLIQYDLREKYNQTFCIEDCICARQYVIQYSVPYLFDNLPYLSGIEKGKGNNRSLEVNYGYKSR